MNQGVWTGNNNSLKISSAFAPRLDCKSELKVWRQKKKKTGVEKRDLFGSFLRNNELFVDICIPEGTKTKEREQMCQWNCTGGNYFTIKQKKKSNKAKPTSLFESCFFNQDFSNMSYICLQWMLRWVEKLENTTWNQ